MRFDEFWTLLDANKELEIADALEGKTPEKDAIIVRNTTTKRYYSVAVPTIGTVRKDELLGVLRGEREPNELVTMTRIVGYYSRVDNWNKSKLSELDDRRRGNYSVEDAIPVAVPAVAQTVAVRAAG